MRYFIGFLVTLGLIILLIVLLLSGGGKSKVRAKTLPSYASTDAQASMLIDGPVNADSLHQQVRITVDRDNVTYEQISGYDGQVVNTQTFSNTENSYNVFLHALQHAGFTLKSNNPAIQDDTGYCPLGDRFIFELNQDGNNLQRSWASNCGNPKTYLGSLDLTMTLFEAQVPGYEDLAAGLQL